MSKTSRTDLPFQHYTKSQAREIRLKLQQAALRRSADWTSCLKDIEKAARHAWSLKSRKPLPYAGDAVRQLKQLANGLDATLESCNGLDSELRSSIDAYFGLASWENPRFKDLFPPLLKPALDCLLYSGRFELILKTFRRAVEQTTDVVPGMEYFDPTARLGIGYVFRRTGRPKDEPSLYFGWVLCDIYHDVTGKPPHVYWNDYRSGYTGDFYHFAKAAFRPTGLVPEQYMDHPIITACKDYHATVRGGAMKGPRKKAAAAWAAYQARHQVRTTRP